jgi:hypothetical protein
MRIFYTALTVAVLASSSSAQVGVLNSNEMPSIGSTFTYRTVTNLNVVDTLPGNNVTWNMAAILPTTQLPWDVDYIAPVNSPHPTAFPLSNYCQFESEIPRYNYYALSANTLERVGSWSTSQNAYSDGQVELTFPLSLGTTNSDTWDNTNSSFGGTYSFTCTGHGTLVLPNATYSDVLLVRAVAYELFDIVIYQWLNAQNGAILLTYYPGDGFFVPEGAAYLLNASIGIEDRHLALELRVQSVANDQLHISYTSTEELQAVVMNMNGQAIGQERLPVSTSPSTWLLDVQGLASGFYLLDLRGASGEHLTARFAKP